MLASTQPATPTGAGPRLTGVNLAGGEFTPGRRPGTYGKDYIYPSAADLASFAQAGMNIVRLPVRWERVQPGLSGPLSAEEVQRLDMVVSNAAAYRLHVLLDVHNYGRYAGRSVTEPAVAKGLADLWARLARHYKGQPVAFGLMNEPNGIAAADWRRIVDRVVAAIRTTGARNLILVPGTKWTGAHSWTRTGGGGSNAEAFAGFRDPGGNFAFEMHQYLDSDSSGTHPGCGGPDTGAERLRAATAWLRSEHARGFLGEFGAGPDAACLQTLDYMLTYLDRNGDVWTGWTYWAAGPWWPESYRFSVQPTRGGMERPQMRVLREHLAR
ncbi:glycoside hydrolase family 5 protein [Sphingomonas sp. PL-96]|uniref:glycoside hydrolase family 5 protein n=1 Tax=Sphingomonas sp. PL-96 TaxID=2887201 RepID=UPI001E45F628|nr:glycoside hydrolase family 5 protein [Sphingomonas sp. PL-96]MCC2976902.1 glycoside hydrolase family 5 protein [Sphingomonas sp. PL-96]